MQQVRGFQFGPLLLDHFPSPDSGSATAVKLDHDMSEQSILVLEMEASLRPTAHDLA